MSRSFKALQSLRTASVFKDLLTNAASRKGVSATKSSVKALSGLQVLSFFSSSGESRSDFLNRLCSSSSKSDQQSGAEKSIGSNPPKETPTTSKQIKDDAGTVSARPSTDEDPNHKHADRVDHIKEPSKEASPADSSTFVDDDIKKQLKRLTEMLEGFSSQSGQRDKTQSEGGFSFQLGSVSGGWDWLMEPFKIAESIYNWIYSRMIHTYMDFDFDIDDFLEGAKDAFYIVNHLFEEGDYETLKPMVSTKLYENMKATTEHFEKEGLRFSMSPENIIGVYVAGLKLVQAKALISFGPEFDIPEATEGKKNFWFLIYVRFARNEHYQLTKSTGEVVQDTVSRRKDLWTFVRGPINVLPIKEESPGWTLLSIA